MIDSISMTSDPSAFKPVELTEASKLASAMVDTGAAAILDNADGVTMRMLRIGERDLPVAVCDAGQQRASFLSPTRHYLDYPIEEIAKRSRHWSHSRLWLLLSAARFLMWAGVMDRVVYPNHWLTVGRPGLGLDTADIETMIERLIREYPDHAVVVSNVVPAVHRPTYDSLASAGCDMVPSRRVWFFDTARPIGGKHFRNTRTKLNRLKRFQLEAADAATTDKDFLRARVDAMRTVYRALNIHKHSRLNPQYTSEFFRIMLDSHLVEATGWRDQEGELACFTLGTLTSNRIVSCISAYGKTEFRPGIRSIQLLSGNHFQHARRIGGVLHWGGGADEYKYHLGAIPAQEFDAVYTRHLPLRRRLPWLVLKRFRRHRGPMSLSPDKVPGMDMRRL